MGQSPKGSSYNEKGVGLPLINGAADYKDGMLNSNKYTSEPTRVCNPKDLDCRSKILFRAWSSLYFKY